MPAWRLRGACVARGVQCGAPMLTSRSSLALVVALSLFASRDALGQTARDVPEAPAASNWQADPLFPPRHHGSVALATGVPFVGMAEATYAPFERFAVGALVGATPNVLGLGLRPRFGVPIGERVRVSLVVPMLYYPTGAGLIGNGPPWFLAQPAIRAEHAIGDRGYAFVGAGLIGVFGNRPKDESTETVATYNGRQVVDKGTPLADEVALGDKWHLPGVEEDLREPFAAATCDGCHGAERDAIDGGFHVSPHRAGQAKVSKFLLDPERRDEDELARRARVLGTVACGAAAPR